MKFCQVILTIILSEKIKHTVIYIGYVSQNIFCTHLGRERILIKFEVLKISKNSKVHVRQYTERRVVCEDIKV